jgi:hypothetical protein
VVSVKINYFKTFDQQSFAYWQVPNLMQFILTFMRYAVRMRILELVGVILAIILADVLGM